MRRFAHGFILPLMILALWVPTPPAAADDGLTLSSAINKAGRQRMLSQRIVKAFCQIGAEVMTEKARRQLVQSVATFESQLAELRAFSPTGEIAAAVARVDGLWGPFRDHALGPVNRANARDLVRMDEDLLIASHRVVQLLEAHAGTPHARWVNLSGRQRMLSQRLAKLYLLRVWGLDDPSFHRDMINAQNEFQAALGALTEAPENTPEIDAELGAIALQWGWFRMSLTMQGAESYALIVAESSEAILNGMELVTGLYEGLAAP